MSTGMPGLEEEITMAFEGPFEDRLAIRELLGSYADAVCLVDAQAWGATWADDSAWELPDVPQIGTIAGKENIVATWQAAMTQFPGVVLVSSAGSIEIAGDQASVRSYTSEVFDKDGRTHRVSGRYEDLVIKRGGKWLFKNRRFKVLHRDEAPKDA
jgi:ketosteroid isomerase-like protein